MHGNHGRSQRRGEGAKQDRRDKAKEFAAIRLTETAEYGNRPLGFASMAEKRRQESFNKAAFEKRSHV